MRTGRRSGTQTWTRRARRRAPRSGGSTPPARRADSERGSISSSPWSEARERVAVATLIDGVGADQRAGRACAIHRVLVGNRIGVVLVEPEKIELLGRLGFLCRIITKAGMTLLLQTPVIDRSRFIVGLARSEEHTSELQSLMSISYAVFC